ncbi:MAG TPA: prepilin peptidase [Candidatus Saccharimonadales bacterium]|nr:prepilin peptidase [Candidatus Saccharimonadales bacterium]
MIILVLLVLGLIFGSFINAFVWRIHEGRDWVRERSECVQCHHELAARDLVPVVSWVSLRGKCRYCKKPISVQYPIVEVVTAALFVLSYVSWPHLLVGVQRVIFGIWLVELIGLMALLVYDVRWMLLPNKIVFPCTGLALIQAGLLLATSHSLTSSLIALSLATLVGGGIFYIIFQVSSGKWIGGGDVKLGFLMGILAGAPSKSLLFIFVAAVLGSIVSLPLLATKRLDRKSTIPFGPFLIVGGVISVLFGSALLNWYTHVFLGV